MARPKRDEGTPAINRLENAFWDMFSEMPYVDITISSISRRAEVNHNTFYYYFQNLDDMAAKMIEQNLIPDLPARLLAGLASENLNLYQAVLDKETRQHFQRVCILAGPHSAAWMRDKLIDAVFTLWIKSMGLEATNLEESERMLLTFAIGGILAVLGEYGQKGDLVEFRGIMESDLGKGLLSSVQKLANRTVLKPPAVTRSFTHLYKDAIQG